ncbi:MAG: nucleoside triphosphate pyrophosphohydrolase [Lachnospiraceae bacterium]
MAVKKYDKLIRDNIPEIIEADGKTCICEILLDEEYIARLNEKLLEEVHEYLESGTVEELADIGEVMHAILEYKKISLEEFQCIRMEKLKQNGGFKKRLLLKEVHGKEE